MSSDGAADDQHTDPLADDLSFDGATIGGDSSGSEPVADSQTSSAPEPQDTDTGAMVLSASPRQLRPDYRWNECLLKVHMQADCVHYLNACLSTLGGAYHLCHHPKQALAIADRTLAIGRLIGSTRTVIRALAYKAVNFAMMGRHKAALEGIDGVVALAQQQRWADMGGFAEASRDWIRLRIAEREADEAKGKGKGRGQRRGARGAITAAGEETADGAGESANAAVAESAAGDDGGVGGADSGSSAP